MRIYKAAALATVAVMGLALGGCGDGGVASTPTPPPPTYQTLQQIVTQGGNRSFSTSGVQGGGADVTSNPYGSGVKVAYTASSDSYTLTSPDGTTTATFGPANIVSPAPSPTSVQYNVNGNGTADNFTIGTAMVNGVALSYTLTGQWLHATNTGVTFWLATGGVPTIASDVPKTGTATYTSAVGGSGVIGGTQYSLLPANSSATFSANFASGTVATSLTLGGTTTAGGAVTPLGTFNGTGTITAGGPGFTGSFSGTTASVFTGNFNGPQAAEFGYSWAINTGTGSLFGIAAGKKN